MAGPVRGGTYTNAAAGQRCLQESVKHVPTAAGHDQAESDRDMPSLFRFLVVIGVIAGVIYGGLWALAHFVEPKPREMTITIPQDRLAK
jgi:hypothetical protein